MHSTPLTDDEWYERLKIILKTPERISEAPKEETEWIELPIEKCTYSSEKSDVYTSFQLSEDTLQTPASFYETSCLDY